MEFRSDSEREGDSDYDEDDDSDDEMPDLIASPTAAAAKATPAKKQSAPKASAFPTRKVRFGDYEAEDLVDENGMVRDGYDYSKHMKEMGHGKFYSANGQFESQNALARRVALPDDVLPSAIETDRLLDAITLTTDVMDSDLREALVNDEAFEEMDDDFMAQAATVDPNEDVADGFDYDAHIAKLMEAASGIPKVRGNLTDDEDEDDDSEFDDDDEEFSDEEDDADKEESQRVLDALFEKTMAEEYGDEDLGELEDDDPETRGELVLEGDLLKEIVDDFVSVRQDMLNDEGKVGNPFRTGNNLKQILEECEAERALEEEENGTDLETDTLPEEDPEIERELQALYTRNAYLVAREQEQWDCETIVSTYSNLDNHPTLLTEEMPNKKKKKKAAAAAAAEKAAIAGDRSQIVLSRKTGMPLGVFESAPKKPEAAAKPSKEVLVVVKSKDETKEEKKARKEAVKQLKTQRRAEKKQWKTAFKEEEQRQSTQTQGGKVSIFKY